MTIASEKTAPQVWTDETFMALADAESRYELVKRLRGVKRLPKGFFQGAPDLAVEVISPSNTFEEIHNKLVEYFENGCRLVWVVNPDERSIVVYHRPEPDRLLTISNQLDGQEVLPGFTLAVADLFIELEF